MHNPSIRHDHPVTGPETIWDDTRLTAELNARRERCAKVSAIGTAATPTDPKNRTYWRMIGGIPVSSLDIMECESFAKPRHAAAPAH